MQPEQPCIKQLSESLTLSREIYAKWINKSVQNDILSRRAVHPAADIIIYQPGSREPLQPTFRADDALESEPSTSAAAVNVTANEDASRSSHKHERVEQHRWSLLNKWLKSQRGAAVEQGQARTNYSPCTAMITSGACMQIPLSRDGDEHYRSRETEMCRSFSVFCFLFLKGI